MRRIRGMSGTDMRPCRAGCPYTEHLVGLGDDSGIVPTARHDAAEHEREVREMRRTWRIRLQRRIYGAMLHVSG